MIFELEDNSVQTARMKVVGGGGGNAVNRMIEDQLGGVEFISVTPPRRSRCPTLVKIQIGQKLTRGLGAGARPEIGASGHRREPGRGGVAVQGADMVFVTCGMGAAPAPRRADRVADGPRGRRALTVGIVTKPFLFDRRRMKAGGAGHLRDAQERGHHDRGAQRAAPRRGQQGIPFQDALKKADEVLSTPPRVSPASSPAPASSTWTSPTSAPSCRTAGPPSWAPASAGATTARSRRPSRRSPAAAGQRLHRRHRAHQHHRRRRPHPGRDHPDQRHHPRRRGDDAEIIFGPGTTPPCTARSGSR